MIEQCEKCKHKKILNGGIVGCLYMGADCRKGEMFDPITNADRIRAMSDEELAAYLADNYDTFCQNKPECWALLDTDKGIPEEKCVVCALEWLRSPAKEEN